MAKHWTDDQELVEHMAASLLDSLAVFPRQVIHTDVLMRACGMTMSQLQILVIVSNKSVSVGDLSVLMGIAKPNITPLVDSLCDKNYVERLRSTEDRRIVKVCITDEGRAALNTVRAQLAEQVLTWDNVLTKNDTRSMADALDTINAVCAKLS